jgi:hypothetical protein
MRPLFTVHAGEILVGQYIEQSFKGKNVWVPTKDLGVDLLVTNLRDKKNGKSIGEATLHSALMLAARITYPCSRIVARHKLLPWIISAVLPNAADRCLRTGFATKRDGRRSP